MIYQTFATLYDHLMAPELYDRWCQFVIQQAGQKDQQTLELACGTGVLATKLAAAGYQVTGLDLSAEMLTLAQQHIAAAQVQVPLVQGDVRDLSELGTYQLVTCFDDSLCYMSDLAALSQVFQQVAAHLTADGLFLFDLHSLHQMDDCFPGYMYNYKNETTAFMWHSYVGEAPHSVEHDLTFFVWDEALGGYQVLSELHRERTYPLVQVKQALKQAGFKTVTVSADFGQQAVAPDSIRWFFTAKKV